MLYANCRRVNDISRIFELMAAGPVAAHTLTRDAGISEPDMRALAILLVGLVAAGLFATAAPAATWRAAGLTFSDEFGHFRLISVSGSGSFADPVVIVEEINTVGPIVLVIRDQDYRPELGNQTILPKVIGLSFIKIVINRSGLPWSAFDMELREEINTPSPYGDGLSFGQMEAFPRPLESDHFQVWENLHEPLDRITFYRGTVQPDATAQFRFDVTDPTAKPEFYLLQEPRLLVAGPRPRRPQLATAGR